MLDVKAAVKAAMEFLVDVLGKDRVRRLALEEVELSEDERLWSITLSFILADSTLQEVLGESRREYRLLRVDATTGRVLAMKMREPQAP